MSRRTRMPGAHGAAVAEMGALVASGGRPLLAVEQLDRDAGWTMLRLRLATADLRARRRTALEDGVRGTLRVGDEEMVLVALPPTFPWSTPVVLVEHDRFVGFSHVLEGRRLCLFLDPTQEWHPRLGILGFLDRLWGWFRDAATGAFDPRWALFHPVGGVAARTTGAPTLVVRHPLRRDAPGLSTMTVRARNNHRVDLLPPAATGPSATGTTGRRGSGRCTRAVVAGLHGALSYGPGLSLNELLGRIRALDHLDPAAILQALGAAALRNPADAELYLVLAVPAAPRDRGVPTHLVAARLPGVVAGELAEASRGRGLLEPDRAPQSCLDAPITWCPVSEERAAMTTRRDDTRPTKVLTGARVVLWGCGGLGSWLAEYLVRAGVGHLDLADPGEVSGGLLVRQAYVEDDIGANKADALARRLRGLRDDLDVAVVDAFATLQSEGVPEADLLIDATINTSVAAALSAQWSDSRHAPLVAQVATDRATSTLALVLLSRPGDGPAPEQVDLAAEHAVDADTRLEAYRCFWDQPSTDDELQPEPGCSVPTFHGSAADLAALAGTILTVIAGHLAAPEHAGAQLLAMPTSPRRAPSHVWLPLPQAPDTMLEYAAG